MASSSSSIFSGVKFSPILAPFNSRESHRSGFIKDSRNKVRCNPPQNRVRVEAQSLIPYNGLWAKQSTKSGRWKRNIVLGQRITETSLSQGSKFCLTCKKTQPGIRRSLHRAFVDRTSFSLSSSRLTSSLILNATVGPDEPHAAGTAWPDSIVAERQDVDLLPPEFDRAELEAFLGAELPSHPKLHRGQLKNGLRYLILPNKVPPNRFEAHMEVHVGSIDEEDDEQGIAHMIEHVAFLGSKKREKLLGTGARSNAYTDFHHTVFHIHSPTHTKDSEDDLFQSVLDALNEIAFNPKFLSSRVEKERRAILSELQMMNTIEYRVDCQLLQHLHSENKLGRRFPIGLEEQIKKWDVDKIRKFHERWYFPANATLYMVGDIDNIPRIVHHIEAVFGKTGLDNEAIPTSPSPGAFGAMANFLVPKLPAGLGGTFSQERTNTTDQSKIIKRERHAIRPPVEHKWSLPGTSVDLKPPQIFKHELLQNFAINMFCKIPVSKVQTFGDLRNVLMKRIFLSALHFRINTRYKSSNPPFTSVELDHSDSGREGCTVTTLTVTAEPKNWQNAVKVAVQEVRRLKEFGVTKGELTRYMDALLKDSEHLAAMIDNVSSVDNLDFIMESDALGHTVMDQTQGHETLVAVAGTVTLEEVNTVGAKVLEFISDFGKPTAPLPAAIVACVPTKVHGDGVGESDFNITPGEILDSVKSGLLAHIEAEPELEVPKELISQLQLQELTLQRNPCFVPIHGSGVTKLHDEETGITQLRLSNGIPVNFKISKTESRAGVMRLIVGGGRAAETSDSKGAVVVGVRTLSEGGRVGDFSREQVELFCVNHLINCSLESTEEFIAMEFRFTLRDNGMQAAFQLLHMVLEHSVWLEDAFDRARQLYLSYYRSIPKSLERATAHKLMTAMLNGDERFIEPTPKSLQNLNLESVKDAVMSHFVGDNMEISIVGDFSEEEIERCILDYLGTVKASHDSAKLPGSEPIVFRQPTAGLQFQQVFLKDTDERACAYIAGPAPNRWGFTVDGDDLFESVSKLSVAHDGLLKSEDQLLDGRDMELQRKLRAHPLFFGIAMGLLAEIINSRLFTTVRDSLGLTYDVSFELNLFDRLNLGWYVISVTSTPGKVYKAVDACKSVLRGLHSNQIAPRELDRAKRTLLMRHEAELKSNAYWLNLLAHLQASSVPRKELSCVKELTSLYEAASIEDIYVAYNQLKVDEDSLYSCIGVAGAQAGEDITALSEEEEPEDAFSGVLPVGRGSSMTTRPTT
ncbi:stromal processing peptidase, chloroplastic isoform X2 [Eutrema salsugineum]|uniref:stromal processing peptidase, chloroplastic isoform X2 n=1 Tax=Eutrema salsugineum TaxID=72664 RepID=UPI000CED0FDA|nr:stromal processing peptidase, chloroplastic isoform X2 [Eutrema salsugineum]